MASGAAKMLVLCMLVLSVAGHLEMATSARGDDDDDVAADAALLRLQELEEEVLAEELALLLGDGKTACTKGCVACLTKCAKACPLKPPPKGFVPCFVKCAVAKDCFGKEK